MGDLSSTRRYLRPGRDFVGNRNSDKEFPTVDVVFDHDIHLNHTAMAKKKDK